jgi:hypothetical protein
MGQRRSYVLPPFFTSLVVVVTLHHGRRKNTLDRIPGMPSTEKWRQGSLAVAIAAIYYPKTSDK